MQKFILSIIEGTKSYPKKIFLTIILTAVFGLVFFAFSSEAQAANTFYVSPTGSDSPRGCTNDTTDACATFNYAQTKMSAGDTLIAKAGTYNQTITVSKPNITIQGELDANGNRLSVIDPYVNVSGGWVDASNDFPEFNHKKVYKKQFNYLLETMAVEVNGTKYKFPRMCQHWQEGSYNYCHNWKTNFGRGTARDYLVKNSGGQVAFYVNFWDGFNAFFSCTQTNLCYLRFDDERNVNNEILYTHPNNNQAILVSANDVTIKDFEIYALNNGINYNDYHGTIIDNNKFALGRIKVYSYSNTGNTTITNNIFADRSYYETRGSYSRGAWDQANVSDDESNYVNKIRRHMWLFTKYGVNWDSQNNEGSAIWISGDGNTVTGNRMEELIGGILGMASAKNSVISNNYIKGMLSIGVVFGPPNSLATSYIYDNEFYDCHAGVRLQNWNGDPDNIADHNYNYNTIYIYQNRFWNPQNKGNAIEFHYLLGDKINKYPIYLEGTVWIYHNSISGPHGGILVPQYANGFTPSGMGKTYLLNNIISDRLPYLDYSYVSNPGGCWYNWIKSDPHPENGGPWATGSCHDNTGAYYTNTPMWNASSLHNFILPDNLLGNSARNAGRNIKQYYSSLPWDSSVPYPTGAVDMGHLHPNYEPADVDGSGTVNIKDIQEVIRCIINPGSCNFPGRSDVNSDTHVNIKDIQAIIREIIG